MRTLFAVTLAFLSTVTLANSVGDWSGAIDLQSIELKIEVSVEESEGALTATINIPQQGARNLPLTNVKGDDESLYFELEAQIGKAVFDGKLTSADKIEGTFNQGPASGTFHLSRVTEAELKTAMFGEAVSITVDGGEIHGSLVVPTDVSNPPVVLIIGGSGPTDRDGNTPLLGSFNNSLKMLATVLADNGIASLRYDKRGIGESMPGQVNQKDLRIEHYIRDAASWIEFLSTNEQFGDVFVIGHSEGSLIGMLAATDTQVAGFVSIAGVGRSADELLKEQLTQNIPAPDLANTVSKIIDQLTEGNIVADVPPQLATILGESVQPYLISWFKYDPAKEISKLDVPMLVVQGTTDLQVTQQDAQRLHDAAKRSELVVIEGMNHILKPATGDLMAQVPVYTNPELPLHKDLADPIIRFITTK